MGWLAPKRRSTRLVAATNPVNSYIYGPDIVANVARFRGEMILDGYFVEPGYSVDDTRELIWKMMRS